MYHPKRDKISLDFLQHLRNVCGLDPARPIVAGISGGPDSLYLLDILHTSGYHLVAAHFNHQLRPEAEEDAQFVEALAQRMHIPWEIGKADVGAYADEQSLSIEEAARTLRYRFLFEVARRHQAQAVVVGHTADDQVETVLMHLLRGAGLNGLRGMAYRLILPAFDPEIPLVRPLLNTWREEIMRHCQQRQLNPRWDASNESLDYLRNRLRHSLLPVLETYNPRVKQALWRMAHVLSNDYEIVAEAVEKTWEQICLDEGSGYVVLDSAVLAQTSAGFRRNLLRHALEQIRPGLLGVDFETLERAADFALQPRPAQTHLTGGVRLLREGDRIYLAAWEADLPDGGWPQVRARMPALLLDWPGEWEISPGWMLKAEEWPSIPLAWEQAPSNPNPYQAWLDADRLSGPLQLRFPLAGDRFCPLGMGGHSLKLSDFFINAKLPRRARSGWPLICDEKAIVWVPGFRIAHSCRLQRDTRRILYLRLMHA